MTQLDLRDSQTLNELSNALGRFANGVQECLSAADVEINRSLEWLTERVYHWQRQVERARQEVRRAEADLRRCQSSGYRDEKGNYHAPNCSNEIHVLARAESQLRECENNLRTAQEWRSRVEQEVNDYQKVAIRLSELAGNHFEKARAFLNNATQNYEAVRVASSGLGIVTSAMALGNVGIAIEILNTTIGRTNIGKGDLVEDFAQYITEDELGLKAIKFDQKKHGFDRILQGPNGQIIILESKANSKGQLALKSYKDRFTGISYKQGSALWVRSVAQKMTNPRYTSYFSPTNAQIGRQILATGAENIPVLATVVNLNTGLAEIRLRRDEIAEHWESLSTGKVLG